MTKEQAIERLNKMIQINNGVIKEARKNGDIFAMQLTADLDTDSIAIETILSMLEEKDKIIDLMAEYISNMTDCPFESEGKYLDCERMCDVRTDRECWKQYFENKAKELLNE